MKDSFADTFLANRRAVKDYLASQEREIVRLEDALRNRDTTALKRLAVVKAENLRLKERLAQLTKDLPAAH